MNRALRIGATIFAVLLVGVVLLAGWFYTTIPEAPAPPPDLVERDSANANVELPAVRAKLLRMRWVDQAVRERIRDSLLAGETEGVGNVLRALRLSYLERRVDAKNTARLKELVDQYGWLHEGRVGKKGADAAFLIAQHADHDVDFQRRVLAHLREAYDHGQATGQQVALLTDRVRVAEGKPQLYGTQAQFRDGEVRFQPIQDSASVDRRRAKMGLPPLSEYVETLKEQVEK